MDDTFRKSLISYLSEHPCSKNEIEKLVGDQVLSKEEAAVLNLRIAAQKLDKRMDSLMEKTEDWDGRPNPCATF